MNPPSTARPRVPELAALLCVLAAFVAVRIPLLRGSLLFLGWDSDAGVYGLMGKRMFEGTQFPIYFWGQSYMGTLTSAFVAVVAALIHRIADPGVLWPLATRLAMMAQIGLGIVFWWGGTRLVFGRAAALLTAALLALGPRDLFIASVVPHGSEMSFLLNGVIFWFVARSFTSGASLREGGELFVFGFLAGFGWWMNQGTVFPVAATLVALLARSDWYALARPRLMLADRFLLRTGRLGWRRIPEIPRLFLICANLALAILLGLSALRYLQIRTPSWYFIHPILEPVAALLALHLLAALVFGGIVRGAAGALRWLVRGVAAIYPFALGALCGLLPPLLGRAAGRVPASYGLSVPLRAPDEVLPAMGTLLRIDLWRFFGAAPTAAGALFAVVLMVLIGERLWRGRKRLSGLLRAEAGPRDIKDIAAMTVLFCLAFYLFSQRAHPGSVRYVFAALPLTLAWFAESVAELWQGRLMPGRALAALAIVLAFVSVGTTGARYAGELASDHDERPDIAALHARGYRICYAHYWVAHRMQFLSGETIRVIPYHAFDRNREESRRLAALPERKCLIQEDGVVRDFTPADAVMTIRRH